MPDRNIQGDRFQLLITFKAIFEQGSLVKAAETVSMTQSAVSKHLQKLRHWFNDDLFVRTTNGLAPTRKALSLISSIESILSELTELNAAGNFKPEEQTGRYAIATTDEVSLRLLPGLLELLDKLAPQLRVSILHLERDYSIRELETGKVDLVISVNWHAPEQLVQKRLFDDQFVCLMSKKHFLAKQALTIESYSEATHLLVAPLGMERGYIDDLLRKKGYKRLVKLSVPDFSSINNQLLGDDKIITLPGRVAKALSLTQPLIIKKLPFEVPGIDYYMFWHTRFNNDHLGQWVRGMVQKILRD